MPESDDIALLKQYAEEHSEAAFAELVARYVNLVYSAAMRSAANAHAAEEISQAVFIILARKAKSLGGKTVLSGWLYQTARLTAANWLRGEIRRQNREQEAFMQAILNEPDSEAWRQIAPLLDDAMGRLGETDRNAIVLRFFENKNLSEIGLALGASEDAAKMRVNRALDKLRKIFSRCGVNSTTAVIAGAVSANSIQAAPVALAKTISAVAVAKGAAASASTLTLIKGALKIMAWTKMKTAIVVGVAIFATGTVTTVLIEHVTRQTSSVIPFVDDSYFSPYRFQTAPTNIVIVRPTHFTDSPSRATTTRRPFRMVGHGVLLLDVIEMGYGETPAKIILPSDATNNRYDFLITVPDHQWEMFQAEIARSLGFVGRHEVRETDVLVLKMKTASASGLNLSQGSSSQVAHKNEAFIFSNQPVSELARYLTGGLGRLVIDQSGLTNRYDYTVKWPEPDGKLDQDALEKNILNSLGLELISGKAPIEMLVVEKAK